MSNVRSIAGKLQAAARLRVAIDGPVKVLYGGRTLDPESTVADNALQPLARIDVRRETPA